jgi:hypothetical protein
MPLYLCRWENGDFSLIQAQDKIHALGKLDEIANAEGLPLHPITDFMVHFRLTDEGTIELEGFGEEFADHIREHVHPVLGKLGVFPYDLSSEDKERIKDAVRKERDWLKATKVPEPETELGKRIKAQLDMPAAVVDRQVRRVARKVLRGSKPKGRPN